MTNKKAVDTMYKLRSEFIRNGCRNLKSCKKVAEKYAAKHGLNYRDGEPAIIGEPNSERVILLMSNGRGGAHMDVVVSPLYGMMDEFDNVFIV